MDEAPSTKKTAIVTGGSGGIGSGICRRLAKDGFNVVVHYHSDSEGAAGLVESLCEVGGRAVAVQADVTDQQQMSKLFEEAESRFGPVDVVVANAGISIGGPVADCSLDDFQKLISVNLLGAFLTIREAARRVRDGGRIIFISSQLAERPRPGMGVYSATKAAIDAMLVSMSHELGPRGLTVNSVRPGATVPGVFDESGEDRQEVFRQLSVFKRLGTPDDVAGVVSFLASHDADWITGQHIRADGGMSN
ncbi:Glucose 1-dehydrogenase 2 [Rubripirellula lacrimiformis]|uniref:Glucose 1-dehydrogenase 2 n=2 Tax=Rubripirellula lacrimiformis TaxID=1930273 RepID=A0A517N4B1_9BACT|nr:Glucose 1-dehydrogenase 2 [Rubripirellula lacrimiformis]